MMKLTLVGGEGIVNAMADISNLVTVGRGLIGSQLTAIVLNVQKTLLDMIQQLAHSRNAIAELQVTIAKLSICFVFLNGSFSALP